MKFNFRSGNRGNTEKSNMFSSENDLIFEDNHKQDYVLSLILGVIDTVNIISKLLLMSPRNVFETRSTNNLIINELMKFAVQTNSRGNK